MPPVVLLEQMVVVVEAVAEVVPDKAPPVVTGAIMALAVVEVVQKTKTILIATMEEMGQMHELSFIHFLLLLLMLGCLVDKEVAAAVVVAVVTKSVVMEVVEPQVFLLSGVIKVMVLVEQEPLVLEVVHIILLEGPVVTVETVVEQQDYV